MSGHECPGLECSEAVPSDMLTCRPCWRLIPRPYRQAVWSAWRNGAGAGSQAHSAAIAAAVDALHRCQRQRAARKSARTAARTAQQHRRPSDG